MKNALFLFFVLVITSWADGTVWNGLARYGITVTTPAIGHSCHRGHRDINAFLDDFKREAKLKGLDRRGFPEITVAVIQKYCRRPLYVRTFLKLRDSFPFFGEDENHVLFTSPTVIATDSLSPLEVMELIDQADGEVLQEKSGRIFSQTGIGLELRVLGLSAHWQWELLEAFEKLLREAGPHNPEKGGHFTAIIESIEDGDSGLMALEYGHIHIAVVPEESPEEAVAVIFQETLPTFFLEQDIHHLSGISVYPVARSEHPSENIGLQEYRSFLERFHQALTAAPILEKVHLELGVIRTQDSGQRSFVPLSAVSYNPHTETNIYFVDHRLAERVATFIFPGTEDLE